MTDQSGWGNWPPQQRPEGEPEPQAASGADGTPLPEPGAEPPRTYGAPTYGAPSYGAPAQQESYGRHGSPDEPAPAAYQQPTQPPAPQQPPQQQPTYQEPTYQQPTYQQPAPAAYQQPTPRPADAPYSAPTPPRDTQPTQAYGTYGYQGTPTTPGPPVAYGQYGAGPVPPTPTGKKRSGARIALVIGIVVVVVAGLGVGAWALFFRGGPAVTWQGKEVANPEAVLTEAQNDLTTLVSDVRGVKADDTRCYFTVPKNPPKDTPKTDIGDTVYCGPALFVDGDTSKPFVPYGITAGTADGGKVSLSVKSKGTESGATALPANDELVRPDGATPPGGAGGLKIPEPPPGQADLFIAVDGVDIPDAPAGATMAALDGGVTIDKLGEIKRYGTGSDARSAPEGQKLIAFDLSETSGDSGNDGLDALGLEVSVNGGQGKKIPDFDSTNVIAVPSDAKSVDLETGANGLKQTLSLLTGKPGTGNIAVLARANRFGSFTPPKNFVFTETGGGATASRPCTLAGSVAGLFYWIDDKGTAKASSTGKAILETDLKYTFSTDSPAPFTGSKAGDSATFEPSHLVLTLPGGQKVPAKIIADRTVFEVPAAFTTGTITVGGKFTNKNAITFTVASPVSFKVTIPTS